MLLGFSLPASASLGGNISSVETDRAQMRANVQVTQHDNYEVHEIATPGGTVVDEYVSAEGTVFAVSWHGQFPPPMQQILGTYFQQYSAACKRVEPQPKMYGHRPLNIQQPGLVVEDRRPHAGITPARAYDPRPATTGSHRQSDPVIDQQESYCAHSLHIGFADGLWVSQRVAAALSRQQRRHHHRPVRAALETAPMSLRLVSTAGRR